MKKMNKKGEIQNKLVTLILLLMVIVVSLVLLGNIANTKQKSTSTLSITNESFVLTSCYTSELQVNTSDTDCNVTVSKMTTADWRRNDSQCYLSGVAVRNGAGSTLVANTDYTLFASEGLIQFLNTTGTSASPANTTYADYTYCDSGYFQNSGDRALANLWTTLGIIALLIIVVAVGYRWMNEK